ncbi:MAG: hypothetical protein LBG17_04670 [Bacteroidales bacterium]|jgi:hypothetical protein|nr:hypothetical protein [Bacteroidales bacterium]
MKNYENNQYLNVEETLKRIEELAQLHNVDISCPNLKYAAAQEVVLVVSTHNLCWDSLWTLRQEVFVCVNLVDRTFKVKASSFDYDSHLFNQYVNLLNTCYEIGKSFISGAFGKDETLCLVREMIKEV